MQRQDTECLHVKHGETDRKASTANAAMASTPENDPASGLLCLPTNVLLLLFGHVVKVSNAGQLLRLALASHQSMLMVAGAEWFWQQQCEQLGWLRPGFQHPAHVRPPQPHSHSKPLPPQQQQQLQQQQLAAQAGKAEHALPTDSPVAAGYSGHAVAARYSRSGLHACYSGSRWFAYYRLRMASRWRLRTLTRKYMPFLNIHSRLAFEPGASIKQLETVEDRLGMKLPWELWELLRFRAGQAAGGHVTFADSCRLLGLDELRVVRIDAPSGPSLSPSGPVLQEQQLAALQQQLLSLNVLPQQQQQQQLVWQAVCYTSNSRVVTSSNAFSTPHAEHSCDNTSLALNTEPGARFNTAGGHLQPAPPAGPAAAAAARPAIVVVFLSNTMGSTSYGVAQDASVHIIRGFTQRRVAGSMSGFLQHLLT